MHTNRSRNSSACRPGNTVVRRSDHHVVRGQAVTGRVHVGRNRMQLQPHPGRVPAHLPQQQIGQDRDRVVRRGHRELPVRVSRVEPRRPLHGRLHLPQRILHGRQQLLAEDGQPVPAPFSLQQLIPEVLAQPGQRHAHGRLAIPIRPPALVRFRSSSSAPSATSKLRSISPTSVIAAVPGRRRVTACKPPKLPPRICPIFRFRHHCPPKVARVRLPRADAGCLSCADRAGRESARGSHRAGSTGAWAGWWDPR